MPLSFLFCMSLPKFSKKQQDEIFKGVLLVNSRHMNRTALGAVHAVTKLYKEASFEELKQILPDDVNPYSTNRTKNLFLPYDSTRPYGVIQPGSILKECMEKGVSMVHFTQSEEIFSAADGTDIYVSNLWETEDGATGLKDIDKLKQAVNRWGIKLNEDIPAGATCIHAGEYTIHILNEQLYEDLPSMAGKQQRTKNTLLFLGALVLIGLGIWFFSK